MCIRDSPRALPVQGLECFNHLGGAGGEPAHEFGVEQVLVDHGVFGEHPPGVGVIQQLVQHSGQVDVLPVFPGFGVAVQLQGVQDGVDGPGALTFLDEPGAQGVGCLLYTSRCV